MPPRIAISGYYGFGNVGDEAILAAIIEALRRAEPATDVVVLSQSPCQTRSSHNVAAISRGRLSDIARAMRESDLVVSGGGGLFQDVTSSRSLHYYLGIIQLARLLRKPVMLYGVGIGPVRSAWNRKAAGIVLSRVQWIAVRDEESKEELQRLGVKVPPVQVAADAVFGLAAGNPIAGRQLWTQQGVGPDARLLVISARKWGESRAHQRALADAACDLGERLGLQPAFLPMQTPDDFDENKRISAMMKVPALMTAGPYSPTQIADMIACAELVLAMRFHALVFSVMATVPSVGIAYDPKVGGLAKRVGLPYLELDSLFKAEALVSAAEEAYRHRDERRPQLAEAGEAMRHQAMEMAREAVELARRHRNPKV